MKPSISEMDQQLVILPQSASKDPDCISVTDFAKPGGSSFLILKFTFLPRGLFIFVSCRHKRDHIASLYKEIEVTETDFL